MRCLGVAFAFFALFLCLVQSQTCTLDDITGEYTRCSSLEDERTLYFFYPSTCDANGLAVPAPIQHFACESHDDEDIHCDSGYFLPLNSTDSSACTACEPGSYSLGGANRFDEWEDNFPKTPSSIFSTFCSDITSIVPDPELPGCGWELNGHEVNSGDMTGLNSLNSVLELTFHMLEDGEIGFDYMCDVSYEGDVFGYKIDTEPPVPLPLSSEFVHVSFPLSSGVHTFRWIFYKNPQDGSSEEKARISSVVITGVLSADDGSCTLCPPGTFQSESEQSECSPCPGGSYSNEYGAIECTACGEQGYSYTGATECIPFTGPCTVSDVVALYSECEKTENVWSRTEYFVWQNPLTCDPSGQDLPASLTGQLCAPCAPGSVVNSEESEEECIYCPAGSYSSAFDTCSPCEEGSISVSEIHYTQWSAWSADFSTTCYGDCANDGWQLYGDYILATLPATIDAEMLLTFIPTIYYDGILEYNFAMDGTMSGQGIFHVTVDGEIVQSHTSGHGTFSFPLTRGSHLVSFAVQGGRSSVAVSISSIVVYGSRDGGASQCIACPAGTYQHNGDTRKCTACTPGKYSDEDGSLSCHKCPANTYTSRYGMSECMSCPSGAFSPSGSTYCQNEGCTFETEDGAFFYNLSPYTGVPQFVSNNEEQNGYYLVSYCGALYESDSSCSDSVLCETYDRFNPFDPSRDYLMWARDVAFEAHEEPANGFTLAYSGGEILGCESNRTASVIFTCEPDIHLYTALTLSETESTICETVFEQSSVYGCPVCNMLDFTREEGDCKNGQMTVSYSKNDDARCNGLVKDTIETCGDVSLNVGVAVVIIVVVVVCLLALLALVIWFLMKNRRLKIKYTQLQAGNIDMDEIEVDEDELDELEE